MKTSPANRLVRSMSYRASSTERQRIGAATPGNDRFQDNIREPVMNFTMLRNLIHRRVQYRITRIGALFVLAVALTGAASFLSANNLLFLIFSAMLALLLVSGFLSRLALSGLELELFLPEHVSARTPTPARVRIRNLKRLTPS